MKQSEIVVANFETFRKQIEKLGVRKEKLLAYVDSEAERISLCPCSTRLDYVGAYTGGLVEHSLRVLQFAAKARNAYDLQKKITPDSLLFVALFHDVGKIGSDSKEYYLDQNSSWHREKGIMYTINDKLEHIATSQLSLWHLNRAGIEIDLPEWYAISTIRDKNRDDLPTQGEPMLAVLLQQAVKIAIATSKGKKEVSLIE